MGIINRFLMLSLLLRASAAFSQVPDWQMQNAPGSLANMANGVAADTSGNVFSLVYVKTGSFIVTEYDSITKFDSKGTPLWNQRFFANSCQVIRYAPPDGLFFAINLTNSQSIGNVIYQKKSSSDILLGRMKSLDGSVDWCVQISGSCTASGIYIDNAGAPFICGTFNPNGNESLAIGTSIMAPVGDRQGYAFVAKFGSKGSLDWARCLGGVEAYSIKFGGADSNGNLLVSGQSTSESIAFDSAPGLSARTLTNAIAKRLFFSAKYDSLGKFVEAIPLAATDSDKTSGSSGMGMDKEGNSYLAFYYSDRCSVFDGSETTTIISKGFNDLVLAKYSAAGRLSWQQKIGGTGDEGLSLSLIQQDTGSFLCGYHRNDVLILNDTSLPLASSDFLMHFDKNGQMQKVVSVDYAARDFSFGSPDTLYITGDSGKISRFAMPTVAASTNAVPLELQHALVWPAENAAGYIVEVANTVDGPWQALNNPQGPVGTNQVLLIETGSSKRFYRLRRP